MEVTLREAALLTVPLMLIAGIWAAAVSDSFGSFATNFAWHSLELVIMVVVAGFFGTYLYAALFG